MKKMSLTLFLTLILTVFTNSGSYFVNGQQYFLDSEHHDEFYNHFDENQSNVLPNGDSEFQLIKLDIPIHFYSETYDHIYINTNGILTFQVEFPDYLNQPFPLEYPSIAPFYSNVDTTNANSSSTIIFFKSEHEDKLQKASDLVRYAFADSEDFEATILYIATWENVGYFNGKQDHQNSFQAVIICNNDETYVQYIYKKNGLNWLQADIGELGISDIRAQAGFVSEDGRYFNINGSGTENARFFNSISNIGVPGVWIYRVGKLEFDKNVEEPNNVEIQELEQPEASSCSDGLYKKCHIKAECIDDTRGFCCKCNEGYYGNGFSCLDRNEPIRVTGSISGSINGQQIDERAKLQSYIVMTDGRSYTAITPINPEIGHQLKLVLPISLAISWLFAKPYGTGVNGYQLTGGVLTHYSTLQFESGEKLNVNQTFEGLNYWDQLSVQIEVSGRMPKIEVGPKVQLTDFIEEYEYISDNKLRSVSDQAIELPSFDEIIEYRLEQLIVFKKCKLANELVDVHKPIVQKNSKVTLDYTNNDQAIRMSILSKVGVDPSGNPCLDGTSTCGYNTICKASGIDSYECSCENGYALDVSSNEIQNCVDIDECETGYHICNENADCENNPGGYTCKCFDGYQGNGFICQLIEHNEHEESKYPEEMPPYQHPEQNAAPPYHHPEQDGNPPYHHSEQDGAPPYHHSEQDGSPPHHHSEQDGNQNQHETDEHTITYYDWDEHSQQPEYNEWDMKKEENRWHATTEPEPDNNLDDPCEKCSPDAICVNGRCHCREGFVGDGMFCTSCRLDEHWVDGQCIPTYQGTEVQPLCDEREECTCPEGYEFIYEENACRFVGYVQAVEFPDNQVSCEIDYHCHQNATCEYSESLEKHICICSRGFVGDGLTCIKTEITCTMQPSICNEYATCEYDQELGRSECMCLKGYIGDGYHCEIAPECVENFECSENAHCDQGVCVCENGFERDSITDRCVPIGTCGLGRCSENAICKLEAQQQIQYCECLPGYMGDGLTCESIPIPCNIKNNCGLHASCISVNSLEQRYECVCDSGFNGDGILCIEEPNCINTPSLCDAKATCETTEMGLMCVCPEGFLGNGTFCKEIKRHESGFLLISQGVVIIRVPFNSKIGKPISLASMAVGLDKDCVEGRVYWGDNSAKKIMSVKYDGSDSKPFISENLDSPEGIAIDWISRRIYWTDSGKDTIEVANLEDAEQRAVVIKKHLVNPRGIAVDPFKQKLYWSDWNRIAPKIEMSNLDGTERRTIAARPELTLPNSLVVIPNSDELCYADAGMKKIQCLNLDLETSRTVASNLSYPFGLANTNENFYWTDWDTKQIESVDLNGKRKQGMRISVFGSHKMYGMTAVTEYCPHGYNPCKINNGGCPDNRICFANNRSPSGKSCKCTKFSKNCDLDDVHHNF